MSGWAALAVLGLAAGGLLWRLGIGRSLWMLAAAALMLGATGYALQGQPTMAGRQASPVSRGSEVDADLSDLRLRMFGRRTYAETFFIASDGMIRAGSPAAAVRILTGGVKAAKDNAAVWTALGSAYAQADGDVVSPAARLAFDQALRLAPEHPGPPFFLGLAYVRSGDFKAARGWWARALRLTPGRADYHGDISRRLALLDQVIAMEAGGGEAGGR